MIGELETPKTHGITGEQLWLMAALSHGLTTVCIARQLHMSERTLRRRIARICRIIGVKTPIEAVVYLVRKGWI